MIEILSKSDADNFLSPLGLLVGDWGGVTVSDASLFSTVTFEPSKIALELYVTSMVLSKWLDRDGRILAQADNSTFPTADELAVFRIILGPLADGWILAENRSLLVQADAYRDASQISQVIALLIYYSILFEWHVHLVSVCKEGVSRLVIEDGIVSVCGSGRLRESIDVVVRKITARPLQF